MNGCTQATARPAGGRGTAAMGSCRNGRRAADRDAGPRTPATQGRRAPASRPARACATSAAIASPNASGGSTIGS